MLYPVILSIVESFLPKKYYEPIKKCIFIRKYAEASIDERGLSSRIREVDLIYKKAFIPNSLDIDAAVRHAFIMDDIWYQAENDSPWLNAHNSLGDMVLCNATDLW